jgi:hypothetical protein
VLPLRAIDTFKRVIRKCLSEKLVTRERILPAKGKASAEGEVDLPGELPGGQVKPEQSDEQWSTEMHGEAQALIRSCKNSGF